MNEFVFLVEEEGEGGYQARALEHSIFTDVETMESLKAYIREAVHCHFDDNEMPKIVRLHFVKGEVIDYMSIGKG